MEDLVHLAKQPVFRALSVGWDVSDLTFIVLGMCFILLALLEFGETLQMRFPLQFIGNMIYLLGIMWAKLSVLIFYHKMLYVKQKFRYFCYAMMASTFIYCLIVFFLIAFDLREIIIVKTDKEVDQSWATVGEITWMTVELNAAIICISLPILSPVYTRIVAPKLNMTSL
ncbi:hypothetical protein EAF00_001490 [Botryotinia globosa]|nr:hypothetical protein EAF00_001490 [Botryotinia globosa]